MKILFAVFVFFAFSFTNAQNYKQVKIETPNHNVIQQIIQLGIDLEHSSFEKDNSLVFFCKR